MADKQHYVNLCQKYSNFRCFTFCLRYCGKNNILARRIKLVFELELSFQDTDCDLREVEQGERQEEPRGLTYEILDEDRRRCRNARGQQERFFYE
jgi:hypothetical protein